MTSNDYTVTDAQLKRALGELAAGPDAGALAEDVLRVVDATPQRRQSAWRLPRMTARLAVLAATVLLLLAIGGSAVLLSGILPAPRPPGTPGTLNDLPGLAELRYVIPEGSDLEVHRPQELAAWYQFNEFNYAQGSVIDIFLAQGFVHPCPASTGDSRLPIRSTPRDFLVDLREIAGAGIVGETASTLDGYPAWTAELDPNQDRCGSGDLHLPETGLGDVPVFSGRSGVITVIDVNGTSYAVMVSAQPDDLQAFLPVANAFVSSIDLVEASD